MRLEPLTRMVEAADFLSFREIALEYLTLRGYRDVELKDGWNDGGSDFAVGVLGARNAPLGVQITVQRTGWKAKVKGDARRALSDLGLSNLIYITSRRLAQADFADVAEELWEEDGISVRPVDSQSIATFFFRERATAVILRSLDIQLDSRRPDPIPRPDLKEDASYAFAFFGGATDKFRKAVIDQSVLSHLTQPNVDATREGTVGAVTAALQLSGDQREAVDSAIDRLLQDGRIDLNDKQLTAAPDLADGFRTMRVVREAQWRGLAASVDSYLGEIGLRGGNLERASSAVLESAGALFMGAAASAGEALRIGGDAGPLRAQLRKRMKEVGVALSSARVPERDLDRHLQGLARLVANSDIGRVLMAGELFVTLASLPTNQFERAFGAREGIEVILDASVAIPMLASLLFEPAHSRFSLAAVRTYDLAHSRGIPLRLPRVYLEEAASHLIQAYDRYRPLFGRDDDLRFSTNAFVAHFADLTKRGAIPDNFHRYAEALGHVPRQAEFRVRRDRIMAEMLPLFGRYDIEVSDFDPPDGDALAYAQEAVAFTAHERHLERSGRLLDHDARTIAYLMNGDSERGVVPIFCTWDTLHLQLRTREGKANWQALDPVMLGDVLILTRTDQVAELMTTADIAMELSEEEGERGAAVLDALVRLEKDAFHDAELLRLAAEFKDAYMQALRDNAVPDDFAAAWTAWKGGSRDLLRQARLPV